MTPAKTSRGRPKGTGLNDTAHLRAIAGLLAAQPDLKPTTAIKKLGIDDPSVIRRLRDKYHASETELIGELKAGALENRDALSAAAAARSQRAAPAVALDIPAAAVSTRAASALETATRTVPLAGARPVRIIEPVPALEPVVAAVTPVSPVTRREPAFTRPSETELPSLMGVALSLFVFGFEAQYAVLGTLMRLTPFGAALKAQSQFIEAVAASVPRAR
jgi:hypothetical protein